MSRNQREGRYAGKYNAYMGKRAHRRTGPGEFKLVALKHWHKYHIDVDKWLNRQMEK